MKSSANNRGSLFGGGPWEPSPPPPPPPHPTHPPLLLLCLVCRTGTSPDLQLTRSPWKLLLLTVRTCLLKTSDLISSSPDPSDADCVLTASTPPGGSVVLLCYFQRRRGERSFVLNRRRCSLEKLQGAAKLAAFDYNIDNIDNVASLSQILIKVLGWGYLVSQLQCVGTS